MAIALSSAERGVRIRVIAWEAGPVGRGLGNRQRETRGQQGGEPPPRPLVSLARGQVSGAWPKSLSPERLQVWGAGGPSL